MVAYLMSWHIAAPLALLMSALMVWLGTRRPVNRRVRGNRLPPPQRACQRSGVESVP